MALPSPFKPPPSFAGAKPPSPAQPGPMTPAQGQAAGAAGAGAAAAAAGTAAANYARPDYAGGASWAPGQPAPPPGTPAYQTYLNYGQGQANAGAAASAAGDLAANRARPAPPPTPTRDDINKTAGLDFMKPGAEEEFWSKYGSSVMQPGMVVDWQTQHGNDLSAPSMSGQYASGAIQRGADLPSANTDEYYNRAEELATRKINAELAGRGAYGSSVGLGQIGSTVADIRAQQAKDSADYGLRRSDLSRGWTSTLGDLAGTADRTAIDRWGAGLTGAVAADKSGLDRWKAGQAGASGAQGAQRTRGQDLFGNNMAIGNALGIVSGEATAGAGTQDQAIMDAIISMGIGSDAQSVAAAMERARTDANFRQQLLDAAALYKQSQPTTTKTTTSGSGGTDTRTTTTEVS